MEYPQAGEDSSLVHGRGIDGEPASCQKNIENNDVPVNCSACIQEGLLRLRSLMDGAGDNRKAAIALADRLNSKLVVTGSKGLSKAEILVTCLLRSHRTRL